MPVDDLRPSAAGFNRVATQDPGLGCEAEGLRGQVYCRVDQALARFAVEAHPDVGSHLCSAAILSG